jgi:hypothetical protein
MYRLSENALYNKALDKKGGLKSLDESLQVNKTLHMRIPPSPPLPGPLSPRAIDAHRGGGSGEGCTSCTPYKDFEKLPHENAIKITPPHLTTPSTPIKRICQKNPRTPPPHVFPTTVHLCPRPKYPRIRRTNNTNSSN